MRVYAKIRYSKNGLSVVPNDFDPDLINLFISMADLSENLHMCMDNMWHVKRFFGSVVIIVTDTTFDPDNHYIVYDLNSKGYGLISDLYSDNYYKSSNYSECNPLNYSIHIPSNDSEHKHIVKKDKRPSFIDEFFSALCSLMNNDNKSFGIYNIFCRIFVR